MRTDNGQVIRLKDYRVADYLIRHVDLTFKLEATATIVLARIELMRNKGVKAGTPLILDGDELVLNNLAVDGAQLEDGDYQATADQLKLIHPPKSREFVLETEVTINPDANTQLMGLYRSSGKYCTQCEAEGFRRITYFVDRPDVLATYTTRIEADKSEAPVLLGNGNPVKKGKLAGGRHYAVWHDPHPKPSYLFALVAGNLGAVHKNFKTASGNKVRLGIYVEPGKEGKASYAMDALVRSMVWDEEVFGCEYDLDVFNIVAVSDFNMGAMENKGLNIFNDKYILADADTATDMDYEHIEAIIAHEYFHNWTGNRITCRDWFQLCLKEGLTVYRDQEFSADMRDRSVLRIEDVRRLRSGQFSEDAGPLAHAVRPETYREINNFYTSTVYQKGAELVRMIATIVGPKKFKKGMDLYFKRHDGDATTIEHFLKCFSDAAKIDLDQFSLWYSQAGTPSVIVSSDYNQKTRKFTLEIEQNLSPTPGQSRKKLMHIPVRIGLVGKDSGDLSWEKVTGCDYQDDVFHLVRRKHKIVFHDIDERPIPSINRGFSAPVNVEQHQTNTSLAFLAANDTDTFNRWQAFQSYAMKLLVGGARALSRGKAPKTDNKFLEAAVTIATDSNLAAAFRAVTLTLPGEGDIARTIGSSVNPETIHQSRNWLLSEIGQSLLGAWEQLWDETEVRHPYKPNAEQSGKRSLRNTLLTLGVMANDKDAEQRSQDQFDKADNMSDRHAAFARIVLRHSSRKASGKAIDDFYNQYQDNSLVLDKWFSIQAMIPGKNGVKAVRSLLRHEQFVYSNPNRVRSVLASFAFNNPTAFHAASGEGYNLMVKAVAKLDRSNPQIAARLLTAFRTHGMLEKSRKTAARNALKELRRNSDLSKDVNEILNLMLDS